MAGQDNLETVIAELTTQMGSESDGLTVRELSARLGIGDRLIIEKLKIIAESGRLIVGRKRVMDLCGRRVPVPSYKITPTKPAKHRK